MHLYFLLLPEDTSKSIEIKSTPFLKHLLFLLIFKMYIYNARATVSLNINHSFTDINKRNKEYQNETMQDCYKKGGKSMKN